MAKKPSPENMAPMDLPITYHRRDGTRHTQTHRVWNADLFYQSRVDDAMAGQTAEAKDAKPSDVVRVEI